MGDILYSCKTQHNEDVNSPQIDKEFSAIPIEIQAGFFFFRNRQDYLKIYMKR